MDKIVVIVGPTASGKTALSVELAKLFNVNKSTIKRIVLRETWAGI